MMPRSPHVGVVLGIVLMSAGVESVDLAFGRDYYVANRAASGAGTQDDPFGMADLPGPDGKLSRALSALQPGDTL